MNKRLRLALITGTLLVACSSVTVVPYSPITVTSIQNNQEVSSNTPVVGQVTTEKPVSKLLYQVNGGAPVDVSVGLQPAGLSGNIAPQATVTRFSFSIGSQKFTVGQNTITITIELSDGTQYTLTVTVVFNPDKPPVAGGDIVVFNDNNFYSGDTNTGSITELPINDPNNVKFMQNLFGFTGTAPRATGKTVWLYRGHESENCLGECDDSDLLPVSKIITDMGMTVQTSASDADPIDSIPAGVKVMMLLMPQTTFSNSEINQLKAFARDGGRVVFVGEHSAFYGGGIATENDFLIKMGAQMRNEGQSVDCLQPGGKPVILPATSLRPHQITKNVPSLSIACSSVVTPGPNDFPLFFNKDNTQLLGAVASIDLTPLP